MINFKEIIRNLKGKHPLVQNITNYVSANDCANILLACGASPVMTDDVSDCLDIASKADGLVINIGTLNDKTINSMICAGEIFSKLNRPIVLDPVGVGVSKIRTDTVHKLIESLNITVIRGNSSEIKYLADKSECPLGVDSCEDEFENLYDSVELFKNLSRTLKTIIVSTGRVDIITDGRLVCFCKNGDSYMSKVTGTGCQLSAVISSFISSNNLIFDSVVCAVCSYGICGEIARSRMSSLDGNASYRNYIIDAMCNLNSDTLEGKAKYEIR